MKKKSANSSTSLRRPFSLRERVLLVLAVWIVALLVTAMLAKQYRASTELLQKTRLTASEQQGILDLESAIREKREAHIKRLESARALHGATLQDLLGKLASQVGLRPESMRASDEAKDGIQILNVKLRFIAASMERLLLFEDKLRQQKIPLTVTSVRVEAHPQVGLNANYDIATYCLLEAGQGKPAKTR
jgi:hypothetical protein